MLEGLIDDGLAGHYSDYAAAEQAAMAMASVASFLEKHGGVKASAAFNQGLKKLNTTLANDERYQSAQFVAQLRELRAQLGSK